MPNPARWGAPGGPVQSFLVRKNIGPAESATPAPRRPHRLGFHGESMPRLPPVSLPLIPHGRRGEATRPLSSRVHIPPLGLYISRPCLAAERTLPAKPLSPRALTAVADELSFPFPPHSRPR